jgi:hypothetical protein
VPKTRRHSLPAGELPETLKRSPEEAQQTFTRALASAVQASGEGDQAVRAAYASSSGRSRNAATTGSRNRALRSRTK